MLVDGMAGVLARPRLRPARCRGSKAGEEQHGLGEAASLPRDRNWLRVKRPGNSSRSGQRSVFELCVQVQLGWTAGNFIGFFGPAYRILEKQGPSDQRCAQWKNFTHLQRVLLFKDSSAQSALTERRPSG